MNEIMPCSWHQQESRYGTFTPIIDYAARRFDNRPFIPDSLYAGRFDLLLQLLRSKLLDYLLRPTTNGHAIGPQGLNVNRVAEFDYTFFIHGVTRITSCDLHPSEPAITVQDLRAASDQKIHSDVFTAGHVPDEPGDRMITGARDAPYLLFGYIGEDLILKRPGRSLSHFCRVEHGMLGQEELNGLVVLAKTRQYTM